LNQEIDEAAKAAKSDAGIVIVRDPARVALHPVSPTSRTFLLCALGGTLLAVVAGVAAAWMAGRFPRPPQQQGAS
jgi:hypothetical protein